MGELTKVCTKCGEEKALGEYHVSRSKKYGRQSQCKACVKQYMTGYLAKRYGNSRLIAVARQCSSCNLVMSADNFHPDRTTSSGLCSRCKECSVKRAREWRNANPEAARARAKASKRRRKQNKYSFEDKVERTGGRCVYCGAQSDSLTVDHVIPLVLGGSDDPSNIVPACERCNKSKNRKPLLVWLSELLNNGITVS